VRAQAQPGVPAAAGSAAPAGLQAPASALGISGDWAMEGSNPARTRALTVAVPLPPTQRRELAVKGDVGNGSPPTIARDTMLIEANTNAAQKTLRALDMQSGTERWSVYQKGLYISPAVEGNRVFIRAEEANKGHIVALDLASGRQLWAFAPKRLSSSETNYYGGHLTSPVVVRGVVFVGAGKEVYALDAANGRVRWMYTAQDYITSSASVDDGRVYISDFTHFYALDQSSGALLWAISTPSSVYFSAVSAGSTVLVTNGDNLSALDAASGVQRWLAHYPGEKGLIPAGVQGQRVLVKTTETLYALDLASGKELWRFHDLNYVSLPAIAGDQVFLVTGSGADSAVEARNIADGSVTWKQTVGRLANTAPVIAGNTVYVRTTKGSVIGFWRG
ncbi:MAG: PQQ-binding-like beta-propeller repeat protein, partial [Chloroflexales bacterium]|nr:PQQ-binding-like beta-propeller repeat protein [Chloroflexales bacterium]